MLNDSISKLLGIEETGIKYFKHEYLNIGDIKSGLFFSLSIVALLNIINNIEP
jgi:hypothetical protein